jgi:hypothetical protein
LLGKGSDVLVMPNIDGYRVYPGMIVGHVSRDKDEGEAGESIPGYFVVDLQTQAVHQGLSKKSWEIALAKRNVTGDVALHKPSRYDRYLGYNGP